MLKQFYILTSCLFLASAVLAEKSISDAEGLYLKNCETCHGVGPGNPGTQALEFKYQGAIQPVLLQRKGLTPQFIEYVVRNGMNTMPFFRKTEISEVDLELISNFIIDASQSE